MRSLSVALLTWEYPPIVVGGLARHVHALAGALAGRGHAVTVYTRGDAGTPEESHDDGVRVVRVQGYPPRIPMDDLVPWVLGLNLALLHRAERDIRDRPPDVLHAHDWLVAYAAAALKDLADVPLVATIHATEHGRHAGRLFGPTQRFIHAVERWLTAEADRVITCSGYMRRELSRVFGVSSAKLDMIPNQVDAGAFDSDVGERVRAAVWPSDRPLIVFAGRLQYEKGVQTILQAVPLIERGAPGVGVLITGRGTYQDELVSLAAHLSLDGRVRFEGFVDEERLRRLYAAADVVVVPSLYEPFGLVALESMASGTPVVAADTGGLREIVDHGVTGLRFVPGDPGSLARAVVRVLTDRSLAAGLASRARASLAERGSWADAASRTADVYRQAFRGGRSESPSLRAVRDAGR
ncbi:MAG TPA: glycosyltransferase family 4 protein [Actinomycetota bacterium]|nr:glycosyltransferase family 4 protein [Actinomycetota bacterium]